MNKKQKNLLIIVGILSLIFVSVFVVQFTGLYLVNGGNGNGDPPIIYDSLPSAPILNDIQPDPDYDGIIELSWSASTDVHYYNVYRILGDVELKITGIPDNSYTDIAPKEDGLYYYRIEAVNNIGKVQSNTKTVTIEVSPDPTPTIPDSPILRLMVNDPNTDGEIDLEWDLVSGATMYTIFRWKDGINPEILKQDFSENYYDDSVSSNGVYSYKVKAGNIEKEYSEYSNEISITVQMAGVPDVPVMNQLDFEIINYTVKVYIDWDVVDCDNYVLYRSFNGEVYKPVEGGLHSTTSYTEILTEAGTYVYKVSAVNIYGESGLSNSVTIEVTKDGGVAPPPTDYTTLYILLGILGVLTIPIAIILVKRKKR